MTDLADDYAARAESFRRLADAQKNEAEKAGLLAIAEQYDAVAARLRDPDPRPG